MFGIIGIQLTTLADTSAVSRAMQSTVNPLVATIVTIASLACVFFLIVGGIHYMTSAGRPDKLEYAKKIIRNALIGLTLIIGAADSIKLLKCVRDNLNISRFDVPNVDSIVKISEALGL